MYAEFRPVAYAGCRISEISYYGLGGVGETNFVVIREWFQLSIITDVPQLCFPYTPLLATEYYTGLKIFRTPARGGGAYSAQDPQLFATAFGHTGLKPGATALLHTTHLIYQEPCTLHSLEKQPSSGPTDIVIAQTFTVTNNQGTN